MKLRDGRIIDGRGRNVDGGKKKGRPKSVKLEDMNKEELIKYIKMIENIKKAMAYLRERDPSIK
jgi:hypothetical protein